MNKSRVLSGLLAICTFFTSLFALNVGAIEEADYFKVILSMYSNLVNDGYISGLYKDNVFFVTLEDICKLTGSQITSQNEKIEISANMCLRTISLDVESQKLSEYFYNEVVTISLPSIVRDGIVYVSALHFLRYIGADVKLDKNTEPQFTIVMRYNIWDAMAEFLDRNTVWFWWDEVDTGEENLEDKLVNAGLVALINRDSNVFRMMVDPSGIAQEALEDVLVSVVKNEGVDYIQEQDPKLRMLNLDSDAIGVGSDWLDFIKDIYSTDSTTNFDTSVNKLVSKSSNLAGATTNLLNAIEVLRQFDNMTEIQKTLLQSTIISYSENSSTLYDGWEILLEAAMNIHANIQSEYNRLYSASADFAESTMYDLINGAANYSNPVSLAWDSVMLITKLIPFSANMIDKKTQLYNAYNASMIELITNEILVSAYSDLYYNNWYTNDTVKQQQLLERIKDAMILQLKSTLTAREFLIQSGFLDDSYQAEMMEKNKKAAQLLNRIEDCKVFGINSVSPEYSDDLSWIPQHTDLNNTKGKLLSLLKAKTADEVVEFVYDDFDNNGTFEAFGITAIGNYYSEEKKYNGAQIWYVDSNGATMIKSGMRDPGYLDPLIVINNRKFICWLENAANYGTFAQIFGVNNGQPFTSSLSGKYNGVSNQSGKYLAFSWNHDSGGLGSSDYELGLSETNDLYVIGQVFNTSTTEVGTNTVNGTTVLSEKEKSFINQLSAWMSYSKFSFDSSTSSSADIAKLMYTNIIADSCWAYEYFWGDKGVAFIVNDESQPPDPLNKFAGKSEGYYQYSAKNVDWIVKNIFNVSPSLSGDFAGHPKFYCHRDSYYFVVGYEQYELPDCEIEKTEVLGDGNYLVTINCSLGSNINPVKMTLKPKIIEGTQYLTVLKVQI